MLWSGKMLKASAFITFSQHQLGTSRTEFLHCGEMRQEFVMYTDTYLAWDCLSLKEGLQHELWGSIPVVCVCKYPSCCVSVTAWPTQYNEWHNWVFNVLEYNTVHPLTCKHEPIWLIHLENIGFFNFSNRTLDKLCCEISLRIEFSLKRKSYQKECFRNSQESISSCMF